MNGKILIIFIIILIIFTSGCLNDECKDLEKELNAKNMTCRCMKSTVMPKLLENRTDVKPKCFCVCKIGGEWQNISIVQTTE
ncbi:MAG: hypothetical protein ACTSWR_12205 [Candidatus Helarchaeota archaeon]